MVNGIINVYKEAGFTSFDVVAKLRGILHEKKIGHTGTLDPAATGVLLVCVGNATKVCDLITDMDKTYEAVLHLGITTDTEDATGTVLSDKTKEAVKLSEEKVKDVIMEFVGEYAQIPPMYSARKVGGKKLYELARAGIEVERKAHQVKIYSIEIIELSLPYVRFRVHCSKGTYIRTLCSDIGDRLGTGGSMERLERIRVGGFLKDTSHSLKEIEASAKNNELNRLLLPVDFLFSDLPALSVKPEAFKLLQNGNKLYASDFSGHQNEACHRDSGVRVYDMQNNFYAIYQYDKILECYKVRKMFGTGKL